MILLLFVLIGFMIIYNGKLVLLFTMISILLKTMLRHVKNKEVVGGSWCGFTRGNSCLTNMVGLFMVGLQHCWTGAEQTCAKHLPLSRVTTLSLNWRDMDMMDGLQQVSHETEVYRLTPSKKRSNKHWQAKRNVHLEHQYSIRINAKF